MRLSSWLIIVVLLQAAFMVSVEYNWIDTPKYYDVYHEDLVFILKFMTWFIVRAIEESITNISINTKDIKS